MSCLFDSLGRLTGVTGDRVRRKVCDHLASNPPLLDGGTRAADAIAWQTDGMAHDEYVRRMRKPETWGGAIEIKAFCDMTGLGVEVRDLRTGRSMAFAPRSGRSGPPDRTLHISWDGGHFEPL